MRVMPPLGCKPVSSAPPWFPLSAFDDGLSLGSEVKAFPSQGLFLGFFWSWHYHSNGDPSYFKFRERSLKLGRLFAWARAAEAGRAR